jgi:hypothetical protein
VTISNNTSSGALSYPTGVASVPDIDGDGYNELMLGDIGQNAGWVFLGKTLDTVRTGAFTAFSPQTLTPPAGIAQTFGAVATALDMDYDGLVDLVVGTSDASGNVFVFSQAANHSFTAPTAAYATGNNYYGQTLLAGDLNEDSHLDLLVGTTGSFPGWVDSFFSGATRVSPLANGHLTGAIGFGVTLAQGDVDGDGNPDLIVGETGVGNGTVYIFH